MIDFLGTLPNQDGSHLEVSAPTSIGSRVDVPNVKKKHRRVKSTSRGSDLSVDAGKYQPFYILLIWGFLHCTFVSLFKLFLIFTVNDTLY